MPSACAVKLRIEVRDLQGSALAPSAELVSDVNQLRRTFQVALDGRYTAQDLPFGVYRLSLSAAGFASWTSLVEIELYRKDQRGALFQIQAANLNNRVNVINFASLFSGTAVAPARSVSARLKLTF